MRGKRAAAVWRHLQVHSVSVNLIPAVAVRARALEAEPAVARDLELLVAHALELDCEKDAVLALRPAELCRQHLATRGIWPLSVDQTRHCRQQRQLPHQGAVHDLVLFYSMKA